MAGRPRTSLSARFWPKVKKTDGCWPWTASLDRWGYGQIMIHTPTGYTMAKAHRVAFEFSVGPIPDGLSVLHTCDNPACVNPAHLYCGTQKQNAADMVSRGRSTLAERNAQCKLTREQVIAIREARRQGTPGQQLAEEYGVMRTTIYDIASGRKRKRG